MTNKINLSTNVYNWWSKKSLSAQSKQITQTMIWLGGNAIYKYWFNLECQGLENLPKGEGYIIAANHNSHLDGPAIVAAHGHYMQRRVYSLAAKDYFFNQSAKAWICYHILNMIPFNRRGKFLDCLPICKKIIAEKKAILFFPEGTRSVTGEFKPLKHGIGFLVSKLDVPVIPAYIQGTYQSLPKGRIFPHKHPIYVYFGPPLRFEKTNNHQDKSDTRICHQKIAHDVYVAIQNLMKINLIS
ncbi:MAG: lysophospholipid acyltransferase family protein [Cyanobacteria bacterium P01_C01_bin.118]